MKRLLSLSSILLAATTMLAPPANAAGMIVVDPVSGMPAMPVTIVRPLPGHPTPRPGTRPLLRGQVSFGLRLQGADIKVEITDQVAKTYITQTFVNDTDRNLAGTYLFPLPEDTTFSSFSLHIDGKPVEGKILEANEARTQYEEIVRRMVDPGLLEYADYKTVRARIFPIPAHGTKKVELEYTQLLKAENGLLKYRFPLKMETEAGSAEDVKIGVKIASKQGLRTIWSPTHTITTKRDGDHNAKVAFAGQDVACDKDFFLYYSVSDKDMAANLLTHKASGEDGYYLLTLTPPVEAKAAVGKDIVLVADTSGSMQGERMEQNKKALKYLVNALAATDKFSIVEFNTDVETFKTTLVAATPENKKAACGFIDDLEARGGTNIGDALKTGVTILDHATDRPGYLVLMTDGEPTVGETSVKGLLATVASKRDLRVFDFGVGYDVNTKLLNQLADAHHGTSQYVEPDESIEHALSSFYEKIKAPVLTNLKLTYDGIQVKDIYPRNPKDLFAGQQLLLIGRYKGAGAGTVHLNGSVNGVAKAYTFPLQFAAAEAGHTYLPRIWAMRRIAHLTEVAQDNGDTKEVVDEIIALSKKYGIISAYTSYLVTDPNESNTRLPAAQTAVSMGGVVPPSVRGRLMNSFDRREQARLVPAPKARRVDGPGFAAHGSSVGAYRLAVRPTSSAAMLPSPPLPSAGDSLYASYGAGGGGVGTGHADADSFGDEGVRLTAMDSAPAVRDFEMKKQFRQALSEPVAGKLAVKRAKEMDKLKDVIAEKQEASDSIKHVDDKTFYLRGGFWTESDLDSSSKPEVITFGSKEYFDLVKSVPGIGRYMAVGRQVIFTFKGHTYKIVQPAGA